MNNNKLPTRSSSTEVQEFLSEVGYPKVTAPAFDPTLRHELIARAAEDREKTSSANMTDAKTVTLVLEFHPVTSRLKLCKIWRQQQNSLPIPLNLRVAWKVAPNAARKLYKFNWPSKYGRVSLPHGKGRDGG